MRQSIRGSEFGRGRRLLPINQRPSRQFSQPTATKIIKGAAIRLRTSSELPMGSRFGTLCGAVHTPTSTPSQLRDGYLDGVYTRCIRPAARSLRRLVGLATFSGARRGLDFRRSRRFVYLHPRGGLGWNVRRGST